eukprot:TRINITY_DN19565_c0_g1_i1.p1 TRINITY_DN19565_c0_g1~~TRINITY_DN19565_c0_g1_i1.p1  ORF type:complete len:332 (+),score=73.82 TRINITY_DN19565_c0_g1_i1:34-1029(+)
MSISIPTVSLRGNEVLPQGPTVTGATLPAGATVAKPLPLFRDLGKPVSDLLTKSFPNSLKLELITAQDNGLKFTFAAERRRNPDLIFVSSQCRFELNTGLTLVGTIDSEKLEGEVTLNNVAVRGLKTTFKGKFLDNNKSEASAEAAYATPTLSGALGLFYKDDRARLETQALVPLNFVTSNFAVGGLASYNLPSGTQEGALDNFQAGFNYIPGRIDFTTFVRAARAKGSPTYGYSVGSRVLYRHDVVRGTTFGADVNYVLANSFRDVEVKLVAESRLDDRTTVRVAVERSGKLRFALANKINSNLTATLGGDVSALRPEEFNVTGSFTFTA